MVMNINIIYGAIEQLSMDDARVSINHSTENDLLGYSVHYLGKIKNNDPPYFLISAPFNNGSSTDTGKSFLFHSQFGKRNIDSTEALITLSGSVENEEHGLYVASQGDIDGDGLNDLITLHPSLDSNQIHIYLAKDIDDWSSNPSLTLTEPNLTPEDITNRYLASQTASIAGDLNGDGIDDIVIGSTRNTDASNPNGRVVIIFGKTSIDTLSGNLTDVADITLTGTSSGENAGYSVSIIHDINNDGYDECLIGTYDEESESGSKSFLIYGSHSNLNSFTEGESSVSLSESDAIFHSKNSGTDGFGHAVRSLGDINGDSFGDFAISAPNTGDLDEGAIYLYYGSSSPFSGDYISTNTFSAKIASSNSYFLGLNALQGQVDLNGDLIHDLAIGEFLANDDNGQVHIVTTNETLAGNIELTSIASAKIVPNESDGKIGFSISSGGDLNVDGIHDILIGSNGANSNKGLTSFFQFNSVSTPNPSTIDTLSFYSDDTFSSPITELSRGNFLYIEAKTSDPDTNKKNLIQLEIDSSTSTKNLSLTLLETAKNSGIYRGKTYLVGTRTSDISKQLKATKSTSITVKSPFSNDINEEFDISNAIPSINNISAEQIGTLNNTVVRINYWLQDYDNDPINFTNNIEYSLDDGTSWNTASLSGTTTDITSFDLGITHNAEFEPLLWDLPTDL
ncbi:hypothetical protein DID78_07005, partial [Candidatus Marinamargulisbacteria bacterium SCGC AG-343-D04]